MTNNVRINPRDAAVQINQTDNIVNLVSGATVISATTDQLAAIAAGENPSASNPFVTESAVDALMSVVNVADYGATGDGTTDDTAAINAAITAVRAMNAAQGKYAALMFMQDSIYKITSPINLTNIDHVIIRGNNAIIKSYGLSGKVAFDMLGSMNVQVDILHFTSDATNPPSCHVSLGRSTTGGGDGSSQNTFTSCSFNGYWTAYAIYNDSCELCVIDRCMGSCSGPTTAKGGIFYGGYDDESIPSDFVTRSSTHSAAMIFIEHCNFGCANTLTNFVPYYIGHIAGSVTLRDTYGYTYNDMPVVKTNGNVTGLTITNLLVEGSTDKAVHFSARSGAGTVSDVLIAGCGLGVNAIHQVYQDAGCTLKRLTIESCSGSVTGGTSALYFAGSVEHCKINQWWAQDTGTVYFYDLIFSRVELYYHTITVANLNLSNEVMRLGARMADVNYTFYNGTVLNDSGIDSDTRIESDTEENMLLVDASADKIYLGGTTNGIEISKGGTLKLLGTATVWQDIDFPIIIRTTGANIPTLTALNGNITMPLWQVDDFNVCESQEFIHAWKEGSTCYWHLHLTTGALDASARYVRFTVEYGYVTHGGVWTFPATMNSGDLLIPANTPAKTMFIYSLGSFTPTGILIGGHCVARLTRVAASGAAPGSEPWIPMLQMHVECDTLGSNTIDQK